MYFIHDIQWYTLVQFNYQVLSVPFPEILNGRNKKQSHITNRIFKVEGVGLVEVNIYIILSKSLFNYFANIHFVFFYVILITLLIFHYVILLPSFFCIVLMRIWLIFIQDWWGYKILYRKYFPTSGFSVVRAWSLPKQDFWYDIFF